jgi:nucleoside-diphosphate-sugar epimerase
MKRVLVSGASGFIGSHSLPHLRARGFDVHAIAYRRMPLDGDGVQWHCADLLDRESTRELLAEVAPTHLLHFAWYAEPGKYQESEGNSRWYQAGVELMRAFAESGGLRAVFAGTCLEYDIASGYCTETITPCVPTTRYGASKLALATMVTGSQPAGMSTAWARIFHLYGPREDPRRLVSSVIRSLLRGERARCTHGQQVRDFTHVDDLASAFVSILESAVEGIVNIGSGEPVMIRTVVSAIAESIGAPESIDFGAIVPTLNDPPILIPDTSRLRNEVGWTPGWTLNEGLAQTIDWWRTRTANISAEV